jgi:hypothetical protein
MKLGRRGFARAAPWTFRDDTLPAFEAMPPRARRMT